MNVMPTDNETPEVSRRDFLSLAWKSMIGISSVLGFSGLWKFLSYQSEPIPITKFDLGLFEEIPNAVQVPIPEARAVIMRSGSQALAYSLVCPHLGCTLNLVEDGFECPCHGSRFDRYGQVLHGPADKPLNKLTVVVQEDDHLLLDSGKIIVAEERKKPVDFELNQSNQMQSGSGSNGSAETKDTPPGKRERDFEP